MNGSKKEFFNDLRALYRDNKLVGVWHHLSIIGFKYNSKPEVLDAGHSHWTPKRKLHGTITSLCICVAVAVAVPLLVLLIAVFLSFSSPTI